MGTSSRGPSATRSRSPREFSSRIIQNIPEIFRTQRTNMAAPAPTPSTTRSPEGITLTPTEQPSTPADNNPALNQQPSLNDLRAVAADIKDTLFATITDLRHEIQAIAGRVQRIESTTAQHNTAIRKVHHYEVDTHLAITRSSATRRRSRQ